MKNQCLETHFYNFHPILIDRCENVLLVETNSLDANTLFDISNHCFDLYKFRLGKETDANYKIGSLEYDVIYKSLIKLLVSYNPHNFSFSISSNNPSLHFIIRLPNDISVFLETFIDQTDNDNTYLQVLSDETPILQVNGDFDDCLKSLEDVLVEKFPEIVRLYSHL